MSALFFDDNWFIFFEDDGDWDFNWMNYDIVLLDNFNFLDFQESKFFFFHVDGFLLSLNYYSFIEDFLWNCDSFSLKIFD